MARNNYFSEVCLYPRSTTKIKLLDVAIMGPFKTHCNQVAKTFLKNGRWCVTPLHVIKLRGSAYMRVTKM